MVRRALTAALLLALTPSVALAQEGPDSGTRNEVILWTIVAVLLSLLVSSVGYLYRRSQGLDHPTPDEVEAMTHHGEHHDDQGGHDDADVDHGHGDTRVVAHAHGGH